MDLPEGPCDVGYYCPIGQIVSAPPEYRFVVYILTTCTVYLLFELQTLFISKLTLSAVVKLIKRSSLDPLRHFI